MDRSRERLVSIPEAYHDTADEAALRIADVGCGIGVLLDDRADAYPQADLLGVELPTEAAAEATERFDGRGHVTVLEGDATELLPEQAPFDVVYAINVIQDTPDPFETLGVLSDALADDGLLVLTVPGQSGTELFPDAISRDPAPDLPYLEMEDVTVGGRTFDWMQYVRPESRLRDAFEDHGLTVLDRDELTADATGLLHPMQLLGDEEGMERARDRLERQREDPTAGPSVELYLLTPSGRG